MTATECGRNIFDKFCIGIEFFLKRAARLSERAVQHTGAFYYLKSPELVLGSQAPSAAF
jgi:hypothetical protein